MQRLPINTAHTQNTARTALAAEVSPALLGIKPVVGPNDPAPGSTAQVALLPCGVGEADENIAPLHILICNASVMHVV